MALNSAAHLIIATLGYADVFHFPLTEEEIWRFLLKDQSTEVLTKQQLSPLLAQMEKQQIIYRTGRYYSLSSSPQATRQREDCEKYTQEKISIAKKYTSIIAHIPSITCIGISGSVAAHNAYDDDDIDLFIICKRETIWITRLLTHFVLEILKIKRKRSDNNPNNKICTNFFITERSLLIPKDRQTVYTAHEIAQLIPLYSKNHSYHSFWDQNAWIYTFLPHVTPQPIAEHQSSVDLFLFLFPLLNYVVKYPQLWYMRKHRSTETVHDDYLAFHPRDRMPETLEIFQRTFIKKKKELLPSL